MASSGNNGSKGAKETAPRRSCHDLTTHNNLAITASTRYGYYNQFDGEWIIHNMMMINSINARDTRRRLGIGVNGVTSLAVGLRWHAIV